eukprot:UN18973
MDILNQDLYLDNLHWEDGSGETHDSDDTATIHIKRIYFKLVRKDPSSWAGPSINPDEET